MVTEWGGSETGGNDMGPRDRLSEAMATAGGNGWPTRLAGYWKLLMGALGTVGAGGVLAWLQSAGMTDLPSWATAGITALVSLLLLLFGPSNKA
jgi:hypothetical protein